MGVKLLTYTDFPEEVVASAAKICYSPNDTALFMEDDQSKLIEKLLESGHMSPFEHASFTFGIDGISRACTHQLVRHRMASYSQQSQRYVDMSGMDWIIPPSVKEEHIVHIFNEAVDSCLKAYRDLVRLGVAKEDARYVLPNACASRIIVTMNARELLHFFRLRICKRAQWEIREIAKQMLALVNEVAPTLFAKAGPPCITEGKCTEAHPCGDPYKSRKELLAYA